MSILTNFLKLVKPEKNDYVDVEEHISKNYDIIDEEIKKVNDAVEKKADPNHTHDDRYYTESEIDMKFKNFCPYQIGDIYLTTNSTNPSSVFLGTTWQKIEGRFLLGTSGSGASKQTGGSNSKTITQANLPNVKLTVNSFSLSRGTQNITGYIDKVRVKLNNEFGAGGAFRGKLSTISSDASAGSASTTRFDLDASKTWTGSTNPVSPQTNSLGSGQALDITPSYYSCHMWLRLT